MIQKIIEDNRNMKVLRKTWLQGRTRALNLKTEMAMKQLTDKEF